MKHDPISLAVGSYQCEPCSLQERRIVRELVRMIPVAVVMGGELVGEEFYCCPICRVPKFSTRTRKAVVAKSPRKAA